MSNQNQPTTPDSHHTPEFKSKVVLEYIRSPKRKLRILKENNIGEELLSQWHQEFIEWASQLFGAAPTAALGPANATKTKDTSNKQEEIALPPPVWGMRINKSWSLSFTSPSSSKEPPSWRGRSGKAEWQERGVVVWDESVRRIEVLTADEALQLLSTLRDRGYWAELPSMTK